jgi:DNA-binding transcriptional LysR family regulator
MNLRHLHYLQLVIEHGSFEAAARAAGVSQPAISHGMKELQRQFEAPLFILSGRQRLPTELALSVAAEGAALAAHLAALDSPVPAAASRDPTLRVGLTPSASLVFGSALHAAWCHGRPRQRLIMSSMDEGRLLGALRGGQLDLVISPRPRNFKAHGLASHLLYQVTPLAYARRGHPLARARSLEDLQHAAWACVGPSVSGPVDVLSEAFAVRRMRPPQVVVSCPNYASLLQLVGRQDLLAVIPHPALLAGTDPDTLQALRLREALPRYEMHLFTARPARRPVARVVAALLKEFVPPGPDTGSSLQNGHQT